QFARRADGDLELFARRLGGEVVEDHLVERAVAGGLRRGGRERSRQRGGVAGGFGRLRLRRGRLRRGGADGAVGAVELAALDRRDHRAVLLLHQLLDRLVVTSLGDQLGIRRALRRQDLA